MAEVEGLGEEGLAISKKQDAKRKLAMNKIETVKEERREKRQRRLEEEERKKREEGTTYEAGGGDL